MASPFNNLECFIRNVHKQHDECCSLSFDMEQTAIEICETFKFAIEFFELMSSLEKNGTINVCDELLHRGLDIINSSRYKLISDEQQKLFRQYMSNVNFPEIQTPDNDNVHVQMFNACKLFVDCEKYIEKYHSLKSDDGYYCGSGALVHLPTFENNVKLLQKITDDFNYKFFHILFKFKQLSLFEGMYVRYISRPMQSLKLLIQRKSKTK